MISFTSQRVIMRRRSSKEEKDRKRFNRDSGALFSDSIDVRNPFSGMYSSCDN